MFHVHHQPVQYEDAVNNRRPVEDVEVAVDNLIRAAIASQYDGAHRLSELVSGHSHAPSIPT
jgi:hypothetical protein